MKWVWVQKHSRKAPLASGNVQLPDSTAQYRGCDTELYLSVSPHWGNWIKDTYMCVVLVAQLCLTVFDPRDY